MERMFLKPAILRYIFKSEDSSHTVRHSSSTLHSEKGIFSPASHQGLRFLLWSD